jgi:hypothetical protein
MARGFEVQAILQIKKSPAIGKAAKTPSKL